MPRLEHAVNANYEPLMIEMSELIERWTSLPVSIIGRIHILKMTIMPIFLYLFPNIPLPPPSDLFSKIKKYLLDSYETIARLCLSLLYLPFERGGFKCPYLLWYY